MALRLDSDRYEEILLLQKGRGVTAILSTEPRMDGLILGLNIDLELI